jgi:hypothetical protein
MTIRNFGSIQHLFFDGGQKGLDFGRRGRHGR